MPASWLGNLRDRVPGVRRIERLPRQLMGANPFGGDVRPTRVRILSRGSGRPALPFPHPWNYDHPIRILDSFFWNADAEEGPGRHNRYLDVPGFAPVLVTRDPRIIRAITTETGDRPGQFDRDTLPSVGIARATGKDTLLFANGPVWKRQKKLSTPPFARTTLFQPEQFHEFAETFRHTVRQRLGVMRDRLTREADGRTDAALRVALEPEIKAVMLEMLVNNFFGAEISYAQISDRYVPALERVIDHIVRDTVINKLGIPLRRLPSFSRGIAEAKDASAAFEELTDRVIATRKDGKGLWKQFKSDASDAALRSNIRVFLAGALEATTSYASWAIAHLARHPQVQEKLFAEVRELSDYTPQALDGAKYLGHVLDETLRLTPSLYFLPRRATADTTVETGDGQTLVIPKGTHILLDVWHANRHEDHWGVAVTGHPAIAFVPERWEKLKANDRASSPLHFGFGHGPRFCPGKSLGQMEVALVVGAFVKLFRFTAATPGSEARAGVSTKPADGVLVDLMLRDPDRIGETVETEDVRRTARSPA
ncbi:MAG TPA: cytochrome P450 [Tepidisphaeraceae bacterium]|nr:cytochrome P450 [Tepidisphaeraceae bacterium]